MISFVRPVHPLYQRSNPGQTLVKRWSNAGICSLQVVSFIATSNTPLMPIHAFAVFAAIVLSINYIFVVLVRRGEGQRKGERARRHEAGKGGYFLATVAAAKCDLLRLTTRLNRRLGGREKRLTSAELLIFHSRRSIIKM